ncbi:MAG: rhodanese-like domain-containing protein [Candidatus Viridilinea halotolerans]|uniref:Rhodanese-like domain-containing protein n=1 Tax=Candidatus Viridilinea halotolerans TaxID=2491704 RepID=A0A426TYE7_9CHLR|nr:MAG: rhodanese-like domain-containing protein [Candidatus Viridilinea halotolerans]
MAARRDEEEDVAVTTQRSWLPLALVGGLVVLAGVIALLLTGGLGGSTVAVVTPTATPGAEEGGVAHGGLNPDGPPVGAVSVAEARALFDAGTAIFIDVRAGNAFTLGHIPGALTITSHDLYAQMDQAAAGTVFIAYGDAERPDAGMRGAQIFMELGYPPMVALDGGFEAWVAAGHPVERESERAEER